MKERKKPFPLSHLLLEKASPYLHLHAPGMLKERYGDGWREVFARLFPVMLTDNGSEFSNPAAIAPA